MPTTGSQQRGTERSLSWPPPQIHVMTTPTSQPSILYKGTSEPAFTTDDIDHIYGSHDKYSSSYAESLFLSPIKMYEYESWASDSDDEDDAEEVEWDAGITDFALFDSDRRRAQQSNEKLPSKWNDMLENQTSALARSIARERADSDTEQSARSTAIPEEVPSLTPDNSPSLRDSLDIDSYHGQNAPRPSVPNYLKADVEKSDEKSKEDERESDEESSKSTTSEPSDLQAKRKSERPGLRHSRTMSGQVHAWTPPSREMYTVGEEPDAERREELSEARGENSADEEESRGRKGRRR